MAENTRTWCAMEAEFKAILVHNNVSDDCMQKYVQQFAATTAKRRCTVYKGMILAKFLSWVRTTPLRNGVNTVLNGREMVAIFERARERLLGEQFQNSIVCDMITNMEHTVMYCMGGWIFGDGDPRMYYTYMYRVLEGQVQRESPTVALLLQM